MGLTDKIFAPVRGFLASHGPGMTGYETFTEHSPAFAPFDGNMYQHSQTRAIVECIANACSKLKPEFVTPDDSGGSLPRIQRMIASKPNDMQTWPDFIRIAIGRYLVDTTGYIVPGYDGRSGEIVALYSLRPARAEVVEYKGEPYIRFHLRTGEVLAYPFYDVAILTRFQLGSDIFGGGNVPLTPTLRLMDAQRQAEEIALKSSADIKFIGKTTTLMHDDDLEKKRDRFARTNLSTSNKSGLMLYDSSIDNLVQVKPDHFVISAEEMARIDKALYAYFTINEKILNGSYSDAEWGSWYEACIEPKGIMLGSQLTRMLLTPTQMRKGNHIMFSSSYLEYATTDSKIKVANLMMTAGIGTRNEVRDIFQMARMDGGDVYTFRGEYYLMDENNNIIAESGGRTDHDVTGIKPDITEDTDDGTADS